MELTEFWVDYFLVMMLGTLITQTVILDDSMTLKQSFKYLGVLWGWVALLTYFVYLSRN